MQSSFTQKPSAPLNDDGSVVDEYGHQTGPSFAGSGALLESLLAWRARLATDETLRSRILTHGTMVLVVLLVIALSQLESPWGTINTIKPIKYSVDQPSPGEDNAEQAAPLTLPTELNDAQDGVLVRGAVPRTTILQQPQAETAAAALGTPGAAVREYTVELGDTITSIAQKFGINVETIVWSNPELELNPDLLSIGQNLTILPVDGVYHQVGGNDTIAGIAATFKTDPQLIIDHPANDLDPDNLIIQPGEWLVVPGGSKPFKPRTVTAYTGPIPDDAIQGSGVFGWPATGSISQGFFGYHPGLDIAGWQGAAVAAADSGYVISAGWDNTGYGLSVVVDHGNGFQSLYAHLNDTYVTVGQNVTKGQQLGAMGCTGNCTGPHLHFEIRHGTVQRNPYGFLP